MARGQNDGVGRVSREDGQPVGKLKVFACNDGDCGRSVVVARECQMPAMSWGEEAKVVRAVDIDAFGIAPAPHIRADVFPSSELVAKGIDFGSAVFERCQEDRPNVVLLQFATKLKAAFANARLASRRSAVFADSASVKHG